MKPAPDVLEAAVRRTVEKNRSACPPEERLLQFYAGSLDEAESDEVREHLAGCAACVDTGRDARRFLEAMGERAGDPGAEAAAPQRTQRRVLLTMAAAVALLAAGTWLGRSTGPGLGPSPSTPSAAATRTAGNDWSDLAVAKAEYRSSPDEMVWRDEGSGPSAAEEFARAMEPYERDAYAECERRLASYLARHPRDPRALLYRGVSLLLLGRAAESIAPLEAVAAASPGLAGDAHWYLALAWLKTGDAGRADAHLRQVASDSPRHAAAEALRQRLGAAR